jgi:hypothetical protein
MANGSSEFQPQTAKEYAVAYGGQLHLRVAPIPEGYKFPKGISNWQEKATADPRAITAAWAKHPEWGVCIVTGPESGVFVLDIDPRHGGDQSLTDLVAEHGALPFTWMTQTGGGGSHMYFRYPEGRMITNGAATNLPEGLDVRGLGGQVVAPPTIHPSGQPYLWIVDHCPLIDCPLADAPEWLLDILDPPAAPEPVATVTRLQPDFRHDEMTPADWVRANLAFSPELANAGWHMAFRRGDSEFWVRPGKNPRDGHSAVLHLPDGPLVIFTTEIPRELERLGHRTTDGSGVSISLFEFIAAYDHGGDMGALAHLVRTEYMGDPTWREIGLTTTSPVVEADEDGDDGLIDWAKLHEPVPAVIDGLAFAKRWTQLVAKAKQGKSTLLVNMSLAVAQGRDPFDGTVQEPVSVLFLSMEMTDADLAEILEECGVEDPAELSRWYARDLPLRLDHVDGASWVLDTVERLGIGLVIIDGLNGTIQGAEKDDTPWRDLYRLTIHPLKQRGVAIISADNLGKDATLGPRGSSVKMDKADAVIHLERTDGGVKLTAPQRRTSAFLNELYLTVHGINDSGVIAYTRTGFAYPPGTQELAVNLDLLGVPIDAGRPKASKMLRDAGLTARNEVIAAALKYRRRS